MSVRNSDLPSIEKVEIRANLFVGLQSGVMERDLFRFDLMTRLILNGSQTGTQGAIRLAIWKLVRDTVFLYSPVAIADYRNSINDSVKPGQLPLAPVVLVYKCKGQFA